MQQPIRLQDLFLDYLKSFIVLFADIKIILRKKINFCLDNEMGSCYNGTVTMRKVQERNNMRGKKWELTSPKERKEVQKFKNLSGDEYADLILSGMTEEDLRCPYLLNKHPNINWK